MVYDTELTVLDIENEAGSASTLGALRAGRPLVLDFWHTRCVNCPAALTKLDAEAPKHAGVTFAACALSLGSESEGTQEQVIELLDGQWENLKHVYMSFEQKEAAKAHLGFKAVPFCVVFDAAGKELFKGNPKDVDFKTVFAAEPVQEVAAALQGVKLDAISSVATPAPMAGKPQSAVKDESPTSVVLGFGNDDEDF
jgi:thiol-disulfide isomerase/thioredoxin